LREAAKRDEQSNFTFLMIEVTPISVIGLHRAIRRRGIRRRSISGRFGSKSGGKSIDRAHGLIPVFSSENVDHPAARSAMDFERKADLRGAR